MTRPGPAGARLRRRRWSTTRRPPRATVDGTFSYEFASAGEQVTHYTLTSADTAGADPSSWTVRGSGDGVTWTTIDSRSAEKFDWRLQTRPFKVASPGRYKHYSVSFGGPVGLAEVELLGTR